MGLLTFADAPVGQGFVASQAKTEALTAWSFKIFLSKASFAGLAGSRRLLVFDKSRQGATDFQEIGIGRFDTDNFGVYFQSVMGTVQVVGISLSAIPEHVVIYCYGQNSNYTQFGGGIMLFNPATGAVVADAEQGGGYNADFETGAGTGAITLHNAATFACYDGVALYNQRLFGAERYALPDLADPDLVAYWPFDSLTGGSTPDVVSGGASMTLTNATQTAVAFSVSGSAAGGIPASGAVTVTIPSGENLAAAVIVHFQDITVSGLTCSQPDAVVTEHASSAAGGLNTWKMFHVTKLRPGSCTFTPTGSGSNSINTFACVAANVNQTTPLGTHVSQASDADGSTTVGIPSATEGALVCGTFITTNASPTVTTGTTRGHSSASNYGLFLHGATRARSGATTDIVWNDSSLTGRMLGVAFLPASASGGAATLVNRPGLVSLRGTGTVAASTALDSLGVWAMKWRVHKSFFEALPTTWDYRDLLRFTRGDSGFPYDVQAITAARDGSGLLRIGYKSTRYGTGGSFSLDLTTVPEYVVLYAQRLHNVLSNGVGLIAYTDAGAVLAGGLDETNGQPPLSTGSGLLTVNPEAFAPLTMDGLAVYSAVLSGADRYSVPTPADANLVALWLFQNGIGQSVPSEVAGPPPMVFAAPVWSEGGAWGSPPPVVLTPDGTVSNTSWTAVGAATIHAALASGDADYIESSTNGAVATVSLTDPVPNLTALTSVVVAIRHRVT